VARSSHLRPAAAVVLGTAAVAACGGSVAPSAGAYGPMSSPFAVSKCMRANGLTRFPDPSAGPSGGVGFPGGLWVSSDGTLTVDGVSFGGPALQSAAKACRRYLPPAGGPSPTESARRLAAELAFARCMRANGVPSFPDPGANGRRVDRVQSSRYSPAFDHAAAACRSVGR
jgi:hypothetical protein